MLRRPLRRTFALFPVMQLCLPYVPALLLEVLWLLTGTRLRFLAVEILSTAE